mmetsp:Transcript_35066/g.84902  ORF Transcript_35066/g.84902 Transcript_35066/m.84902 type:complete len:203 (+) Transcript_35066:124-732(+)
MRGESSSIGIGLDLDTDWSSKHFVLCQLLVRGQIQIGISSSMLDLHTANNFSLGIGVHNTEFAASLGSSVNGNIQFFPFGNFPTCMSMATHVNDLGMNLFQVANIVCLFNLCFRVSSLATIIRRKFFDINNLAQLFFPLLPTGDDFDLAGSTRIYPTLDQLPGSTKESWTIDNVHLAHCFRETEGINSRLILDNGQCSLRQL